MDLLGVVDGTTTTTLLTGNRVETSEHRFLDWTLNGKLLRTMLGWENPPSDCTCMVSGWDLDAGLAWLESLRFEGAGGFPDGRAAVLVCPECGDVVREVSFADTSLQYCATCQTGGKPLADRRMSRLLK